MKMENEHKTISPKELAGLIRDGQPCDLIDVRTPAEYREVHSKWARNIPLDTFDAEALIGNRDENQTLYVICKSGARAGKACEALRKTGYQEVVNVEGGTDAWVGAGLPIEEGKKTMSLERQVRITAGALVVTGAILSQLIAQPWVYLSGFVGAGLVFAGITDTCGMGMLLAKMPWNR